MAEWKDTEGTKWKDTKGVKWKDTIEISVEEQVSVKELIGAERIFGANSKANLGLQARAGHCSFASYSV